MITVTSSGFCLGRVSTGLMQATPGEIKSLRSSADRIALIVGQTMGEECGEAVQLYHRLRIGKLSAITQ